MLLVLFLLQYSRGFTLVDPDIARTVLCIFWMLAEPVRLAAGWYGNLQENVSSDCKSQGQHKTNSLCVQHKDNSSSSSSNSSVGRCIS